MLKIQIYVYLFAYFSISLANAQTPLLCDPSKPIQPVTPEVPLPEIDPYATFQAAIEKNAFDITETQEIIEFYDGIQNMGISTYLSGGFLVSTYSYFATNEFITINPITKQCTLSQLNDTDFVNQISPFESIDINGTNHILSPLNTLLRGPEFKFVYNGTNEVRGIPVNQWTACTYSKFDQKIIKATVSFTDPKKWKPASLDLSQQKRFESVPVEVRITTQDDLTQKINDTVYTVTGFKPFVQLDIEQYATPSGVYCEGRKNVMPIPTLPESFSFNAELVEPLLFSTTEGTVTHYYEEYSYKYNLFRYAFDKGDRRSYEIHDFNTGLKYKIKPFSNQCDVEKININQDSIDAFTNGSDIRLMNPRDFFSFDPKTFHFTGFKRYDGVGTEVWIGPKNISGLTNFDRKVYYEWYFMSHFWNSTDSSIKYQIPISLKIFLEAPVPNTTLFLEVRKTFHIFNFRTDYEIHLNDFDLTRCRNSLQKDHLLFSLKNSADLVNKVKSSPSAFRQAVIKFLFQAAKVTPLRISNIELKYEGDVVYVMFSLFEKSSFYGDVPEPENDDVSPKAIRNLKDYLANTGSKFDFFTPNGDATAEIDIGSLTKVDGRYNIDLKKGTLGTSGGIVALVTILSAVFGLIIGITVTILEKNKKISLLKPFYNS